MPFAAVSGIPALEGRRGEEERLRGGAKPFCVYGVLELADRGDDDGVVVDRWIGTVAGEGAP